MAISRRGLSSALCLAVSLFIAPITAQTRPPFGVDPIIATPLPPTPTTKPSCITVTSTQYGPCATAVSCDPVACPAYVRLVTQPCGCPYPAETVTVKSPCGCPGWGCPSNIWVTPEADCPGKPCAVVTATNYPTGCVGIDCIYLSTVALGCNCTGISTKTECVKTCPTGCATQYIGLPAPCASPTATVW